MLLKSPHLAEFTLIEKSYFKKYNLFENYGLSTSLITFCIVFFLYSFILLIEKFRKGKLFLIIPAKYAATSGHPLISPFFANTTI